MIVQVIFDQAFHWGLEDYAHLHSEFFHYRLEERLEVIGYRTYGVEGIFLIVRVMGDYQEEELTECVCDEIGEIRVIVQVLANELCVLRAEAVGERTGVDYVQQLVVVVAEFLADQVIHLGRHVAADIVRNQPLSEVAAGALVTEDEAAGIHVEALVAAVVEAAVGSRTKDSCESRLIL